MYEFQTIPERTIDATFVDNGSFTYEQVNIYSFNYLSKGQISQADFEEIQLHLNPITEEIIE